MTAPIQTIFFDVGNTLRIVLPDQEFIDRAEAGLMELIGTTESHDALFAKLEERWKAYRKQSKATLLDASEGELWTQYMLPEYEPNMIFANAPKLTRLWRDHDGRRVARPDAVATIKELCRRGYTLGIISDLVGRREVDEWLDQDGLRPYFQTVQQSSVTYIRKPGPAIYYYAMEEVGAEPENCCYVGDNLNRDIIGAKAVDFGMTVTVQYQKDKPLKLTAENRPDAKVYRFPDLLDIFPKRGQVAVEKLIPPEDGQ